MLGTAEGRNAGQNVMAFRFQIGQRVCIKDIETHGAVLSILVDSDGRQYRVAYFDDHKVRRVEFMLESELS